MDTLLLVMRTDVGHADGVQVCVGTFEDDPEGQEKASRLLGDITESRKGTYRLFRATVEEVKT